jgi:uncharacterized protein (DUF58 family)
MFCFIVGYIRQETLLTLIAAVFAAVLAYSFIIALPLVFVNRKKSGNMALSFVKSKIIVGEDAVVRAENARFIALPGLVVRYEITVETDDGRKISALIAGRGRSNGGETLRIPVTKRGAYFGTAGGICVVTDAFGFFAFRHLSLQNGASMLLAMPHRASEPPRAVLPENGEAARKGPLLRRADTLIEHRPYMPGDDPRRINWKLFSHAGDLFVREGEREPPPHSRLLLLIDTHAGSETALPCEADRLAVDALCEKALALAESLQTRGVDVRVTCTRFLRDIPHTGSHQESLAYPALIAKPSLTHYPPIPEDERAILILAVRRKETKKSAGMENPLELFVKNNSRENRTISIVYVS